MTGLYVIGAISAVLALIAIVLLVLDLKKEMVFRTLKACVWKTCGRRMKD